MNSDGIALLIAIYFAVGFITGCYQYIEKRKSGDRSIALGVLWPLVVLYLFIRGVRRIAGDAKRNW